MKTHIITGLLLLILTTSFTVFASHGSNDGNQTSSQLTQAELQQLLAPIALYPDALLTHILIASTYPLEVVQAYRWLEKNPEVDPEQHVSLVTSYQWDESIVALLAFPSVLKRLNDDLSWTHKLGEAFLADEATLLSSIQVLRQQAEQAGNLDKMANLTVSREQENIIITPVEKHYIYVPYYDTRVIYGHWRWRHYPPVFWAAPVGLHASYYYHRHHHPFYWHSGIHISKHFFFGSFHWHNRYVVIHHRSRPYYGSVTRYNGKKVVSSTGGSRWLHKAHHRRGVAYHNKALNKRYHRTKVIKNHHGNRQFTSVKSGLVKSKATTVKPHKYTHKTNHRAKKQAFASHRDNKAVIKSRTLAKSSAKQANSNRSMAKSKQFVSYAKPKQGIVKKSQSKYYVAKKVAKNNVNSNKARTHRSSSLHKSSKNRHNVQKYK